MKQYLQIKYLKPKNKSCLKLFTVHVNLCLYGKELMNQRAKRL